jgi:Bax protein
MNPKITLAISLSLLLTFFIIHVSVTRHILDRTQETSTTSQPEIWQADIPNFAAIIDIKARKRAFFDYLSPLIQAENTKIQELRRYIRKQNMQSPSAQIKQLAMQYRLKPTDTKIKQSLLSKIDSIPSSLVLAQAAIESAWGTSRFAVKGNNLFGQWCFSKGCGLVPSQRGHGQHHEVKRFQSPAESIASYMHNLNSHPSYAVLRDNRFTLQKNGDTVNGCFLAEGLIEYSERKLAYVESLKQLIRVNSLEDKKSDYCKKQEPEKPQQPLPNSTTETTTETNKG